MSDDVDQLFWLLSELETDGEALSRALREVERARSSIWAKDDLPWALSELLEAIGSYQWDASEIAKLAQKALREAKGAED